MTIKYCIVIWSIYISVATQATQECSHFTKCLPFGQCTYAERNYVEFCNNSHGSYVCCPSFEATSTAERVCEKFASDSFICPKIGTVHEGTVVRPGEAPFMALMEPKINDTTYVCGGILVNNKFVLSAAHCFSSLTHKDVYVRLGVCNSTESGTEKGKDKRYEIKDVFKNNYNSSNYSNDIILLLLNETVEFTRNIKPACIPSPKNPIKQSDVLYLFGFGGEHYSQLNPRAVLRKAPMQYTNDLKGSNEKNNKTTGSITGYKSNAEACKGDSGGPIIRHHRYYGPCLSEVMAVVSFGTACGGKGSSTTYTHVLDHLPWINQILWNVSETHVNPPLQSSSISINSAYIAYEIINITFGLTTNKTELTEIQIIPKN